MAQKEFERSAGILMPVSSLPSPYGIGTFGKSAYEFVDNLVKARQKFWQVLPLGPTSYGDSPYASFSAFAGNPYFVDLETLIEEGLLDKEYVESFKWNMEEQYVDYGLIYESRFKVLQTAYENSNHRETEEYKKFLKNNEFWLDGYCIYSACKKKFNYTSWQDWDDDIKYKVVGATEKYLEELEEDVDFFRFVQFKFYEQWNKLKEYTNENGIEMVA